MGKPTLSDVAKAAGVSYATADRVINARGNVAEKSIRKVQAAMETLGYVRDITAANLSRGRIYQLAVLIPAGQNAFFQEMRTALSEIGKHLNAERVSVTVVDVEAFSSEGLFKALQDLDAETLDGIAVVGLTSKDLEAPLAKLRQHGVTVVSLVADLMQDQRDAYIGINNLAAGRTAARLIGMSHRESAGQVLTIAGSLDAEDHLRRLEGFREILSVDFSSLTLLDPLICRDNEGLVYNAVSQALRPDNGITAIYNVGAGNRGLIRALNDAAPETSPLCIVHELVPHSRAALEAGLIHFIIDQRPEIEVARAVSILRALIDHRPLPPMPELVPMIYVPDNLPAPSNAEPAKVAHYD